MLTIYHIEGRRSESVVWLCEEIGLPYELVFTRGDIGASAARIREINPLMPVAPTIRYGDKLMVETGAILEFLLLRHGEGRLAPPTDSLDYADYLQWLHFAEGSAATRLLSDMARMRMSGEREITPNRFPGTDHVLVGSREVLAFIEAYLAEHPYFGGQVFSAADIIMDMVARFAALLPGIDIRDYPHFAAWQATVEARPAYGRMRAAALPDGKVPGQRLTAALLRGAAGKGAPASA
jgi:glutathione S-transferase